MSKETAKFLCKVWGLLVKVGIRLSWLIIFVVFLFFPNEVWSSPPNIWWRFVWVVGGWVGAFVIGLVVAMIGTIPIALFTEDDEEVPQEQQRIWFRKK